MNIFPYLPLMAFFANILLGVSILLRDFKNKKNILFSLFSFSLACWALTDFFIFTASSNESALYMSRLATIFASFTPAFLLHFTLIFSKNKLISKKRIYVPLYVFACFFSVVSFTTDLISKSGTVVYWGHTVNEGILYLPCVFYFVTYVIIGFFVCYKFYLGATLINEKKQILLLMIAILIPIIFGLITEIIPKIFGFLFFPLVTSSTTITSILIGYSISKYNLMTPVFFNIQKKILSGFLGVILVSTISGSFIIVESQETLKESIGESTTIFAEQTMNSIDRILYTRLEGWESYIHTNPELIEALRKSNEEFGNLTDIQKYINEKNQEWISVSNGTITPFMQEFIDNEQSDNLRRRIDFYEKKYHSIVFPEVFVTNKYGTNVAQTGKTSDYYQADEDWWANARKEGLYVEEVQYDESSGFYGTALSIAVTDENGMFLGVMKIVYRINEIITIINKIQLENSQITDYSTGDLVIYLLTRDGKIIYATETYKILESITDELTSVLKDQHVSYFITEDLRNSKTEKLYAHVISKGIREYNGIGWVLVIGYNTEKVFSPISVLTNTVLIAMVVITIFSLLFSVVISSSFSKPITNLKEVAGEIAKGNLDVTVDKISNDEVGSLATSFNQMVTEIKKSKVDLEKYSKNLEKKVDERTVDLQENVKQLRENEAATLNIMEDLQKTQGLLQVTNRDLERKVQDRTAEISSLLKQKDEFINQLGHDLKNPLTPVTTLLPILQKQISDTKSLEYFDVVLRNVLYMKNLVMKTLDLARLNSPNTILHIENIDLAEKINDTLLTQKLMFQTKHLKVDNKIQDTIIIQADNLNLDELLKNLLNNAAKYSPDGGSITLDAQSEKEEVTVSIQDTGVGLTKEQIAHIFDEFYKVDQSRHDFDSTGLGLPICKRIVERHGGKIWAESEGLGKGCAFYFTMKTGKKENIKYR